MRLSARLFALCLPLLSLPALAETVDSLYQVREAVASQEPEERSAALDRALETLVLRLTGDPKAIQSPNLSEVRKDPQQLVSQYVYEGERLVVDFDPLTTENKLREAGLPLWGSNRPVILAWWLNNDAAGSSLVGDAQDGAAPLQQAARHRGLPLRLPLADLQEQFLATSENLSAAQPDALQESVQRYGADALLAVQAREDNGQWQAEWRLWLGDSREQGKSQGADRHALADAVLLAVSERLAPRFVVKPGSVSSMTLEVEGADLARYAELGRLLEPFAARLVRVQGDLLVWQVNASAQQLRAQLGLADLREVPVEAEAQDAGADSQGGAEPLPSPAPKNLMRFRW